MQNKAIDAKQGAKQKTCLRKTLQIEIVDAKNVAKLRFLFGFTKKCEIDLVLHQFQIDAKSFFGETGSPLRKATYCI